MKLQGKITICRTTGSGEDAVTIRIRDTDAGIDFAVAELTMTNFGYAVTGRGATPCELEVRGLEKVGMVREHKTESIAFEGRVLGRDMATSPEAKAALAPFEIDGWKGFPTDLANRNRRSKAGNQLVTFERWVPRPEGSEERSSHGLHDSPEKLERGGATLVLHDERTRTP